MHRFRIVAILILTSAAGTAWAQPSPTAGTSTVITSHGPAMVTGSAGTMQPTMIPGSPVPGTLMNNGNGTSTLMIPGQPSEAVMTPR